MQNSVARPYRGYAVRPSAHRLPDGYFSSNVTLSRASTPQDLACYDFYSLGYFPNETAALSFSVRWGRMWIDSRG
ncbi:hypothetical protein ACFSHT_31845 [Paraburkholderia silviterrae]|uniref:Transcriptional regulator n=1 Tax=Paraburkholderia silviterrae TaxID=2528715 RepID=A0A4R5M4M3_9BURK|nr:hypothetical protein [Paraburkholderia silviterrae]TDG20125.1 hypothetical protein EYW47_26855 [Paraburkholderia silviterrae]